MREPDYVAHPSLDRVLTLPPDLPREPTDAAEVRAAWSAALGRPVTLVRGVERARAVLLRAAGVGREEPVALPPNADQALVEAVKRHGARPHFLDLDSGLGLRAPTDSGHLDGARIGWAQPVGGLPATANLIGLSLWVDHADTLPSPESRVARDETPVAGRRCRTEPAGQGAADGEPSGIGRHPPPATRHPTVTLWGLHLSDDPAEAGALLAFAPGSPGAGDLEAAVARLLRPADLPDLPRALAQCRRLVGEPGRPSLAQRQWDVLAETRRGLREAAGLPLLPPTEGGTLARYVAVEVPSESDVATFYAYVRGEHTPVRWLPEVRPLHYAAVRERGARAGGPTALHLARWLLVPVGPDYTDAEVEHAVLGIVKASEYLGVRWRTDPARAAAYAALLDEAYGPGHDAYRPLFPTG